MTRTELCREQTHNLVIGHSFVSHNKVPGCDFWLWLMSPAVCPYKFWEVVMMAQVAGSLHPVWEMWHVSRSGSWLQLRPSPSEFLPPIWEAHISSLEPEEELTAINTMATLIVYKLWHLCPAISQMGFQFQVITSYCSILLKVILCLRHECLELYDGSNVPITTGAAFIGNCHSKCSMNSGYKCFYLMQTSFSCNTSLSWDWPTPLANRPIR